MAKVDNEAMEKWFYFRPRVYFLLTRVFKEPPTEELIRCLAGSAFFAGGFPVKGWPVMERGLEAMAKGLGRYNKEDGALVLELAMDYARVLMRSKSPLVSPRESAYITRLSDLELRKIYVNAGIAFKGGGTRPDDHIATELEFMACLSHESSKALEIGEMDIFRKWLAIQRAFLADHLLNWIPTLAYSMREAARTQFFQGLAIFTPGFLSLDLNQLVPMKGAC